MIRIGLGTCAIAALSTLLLRRVPIWAPLLWCASLTTVMSGLHKAPRLITGIPFRSLLSIILSLVFGAALLETGARFSHGGRPWEQASYIMAHSQAGFTLRPDSSGTHFRGMGQEEKVPISTHISSQGLRDREYGPRRDDEFRILLLGDSFAMGWGLEVEQSLSREIERVLAAANLPIHVTVMNGGVGNYGPWQERYFLNERGFRLEPCLVLHQLFPGNDIENSLAEIGKYPEAYNVQAQEALLCWQTLNTFPMRFDRWFQEHCATYRLLLRAAKRRDLFAFFLWRLRFISVPRNVHLPPSADRRFNPEICLRQWYPALEEGWARFESDILAIRGDCSKRGIDYAAFCIPEITDIEEPSWRAATSTLGQEAYERFKDVRLSEAFFEREKIPFISLRAAMENSRTSGPLYFPYDGHLTPAGVQVTAKAIANFLIARFASLQTPMPACPK